MFRLTSLLACLQHANPSKQATCLRTNRRRTPVRTPLKNYSSVQCSPIPVYTPVTASNRPLTDTHTLINTHHDISYTPRSPTHARHERSRTLPRAPNKAQPLTRSRLAGAPQTSRLSPPAGCKCKVQGATLWWERVVPVAVRHGVARVHHGERGSQHRRLRIGLHLLLVKILLIDFVRLG